MYHNRIMRGTSRGSVSLRRKMPGGGTPVWLAAVLAVLMLITAGFAYRTAVARVPRGAVAAVQLPVPLKQFPLQMASWAGSDLPIPETTEEYMRKNFADDFISRRYVNASQGQWADVYLVYCSSRPGGILGHQPRVCYPAHGWIHDGTVTSEITSGAGRPIGCLIHRFHKPAPAFVEVVVLSFYVLNGQITLSEKDFSTFSGRMPNISGDPARYVAQVQISSGYEHSVRTAAAQMADTILSFLPDQNGHQDVADLGGQWEPKRAITPVEAGAKSGTSD
jgi:hypothetical protein